MNLETFLDQAQKAGAPPMAGGRLVARRLGSTREMCDLLLGLVMAEQKTCTYSLVQLLEEEGGLLARPATGSFFWMWTTRRAAWWNWTPANNWLSTRCPSATPPAKAPRRAK